MENRDFLLAVNENFSTGCVWKLPRLSTEEIPENFAVSFPQKVFPQSTGPVEKILDGRGAHCASVTKAYLRTNGERTNYVGEGLAPPENKRTPQHNQ